MTDLRLLCPCLIDPDKYGLIGFALPPEAKTFLLSLAKIILKLVNAASLANLAPEKLQAADPRETALNAVALLLSSGLSPEISCVSGRLAFL